MDVGGAGTALKPISLVKCQYIQTRLEPLKVSKVDRYS